MNNDLMFSSQDQTWETRDECFNQIQDYVGYEFTLDCCAEKETAKVSRFFTKEDDMFREDLDWGFDAGQFAGGYHKSQVWMNPEYSRSQPKFVKEVISRIEKDQISDAAVLVPARVDTNLFHNIILPKASCITFYEGRLVFGGDSYWEWVWEQPTMKLINGTDKENKLYGKIGKFNAAPFPSMIVEFTEDSVLGLGNDLSYPKIATLKAPKFKYKS